MMMRTPASLVTRMEKILRKNMLNTATFVAFERWCSLLKKTDFLKSFVIARKFDKGKAIKTILKSSRQMSSVPLFKPWWNIYPPPLPEEIFQKPLRQTGTLQLWHNRWPYRGSRVKEGQRKHFKNYYNPLNGGLRADPTDSLKRSM